MNTLIPVDRFERRNLLAACNCFDQLNPQAREFLDPLNPAPRTPLLWVLDVSSSMFGRFIKEVGDGMQEITRQFSSNPAICRTVEMAVIGFGRNVVVRHAFAPPDRFKPPRLRAGGLTPLAEAGLLSIKMVEERLDLYREAEIDLKVQPQVFFLTDGAPTSPPHLIDEFAQQLRRYEQERVAAYHALHTAGADASQLARIFVRRPIPLASFLQAIRGISQSVVYASMHLVTPDFDFTENLHGASHGHHRDGSPDDW